jgi:3-oxoacyl-[acyl-carrier protein] reductase
MSRQTNYSASKAGIIGFTKSLAKEVASYNIRVNAVAPGFIETDMLKGLKEEYKSQIMKQIPLCRFGRPEEVARVVRFLISDEAGYITGQTIVIDGGMS